MSDGDGSNVARPKKKTSTLTILFVIMGAGFLLLLLAAAIGTYAVMSSDKGRAFVGMMGEAIRIAERAQKAPGTKELRAAGCKQAMVMSPDDFVKMTSHLDSGPEPQAPFGELVVCTVPPWGTAPACDALASTYIRAVGSRARPFAVSVQQQGKPEPACTLLYDESGEKLRDVIDAPNIAPAPEE